MSGLNSLEVSSLLRPRRARAGHDAADAFDSSKTPDPVSPSPEVSWRTSASRPSKRVGWSGLPCGRFTPIESTPTAPSSSGRRIDPRVRPSEIGLRGPVPAEPTTPASYPFPVRRLPVRRLPTGDYGFLQIPPRDGHPCLALRFRSPRPAEDFHLLSHNMPGTHEKTAGVGPRGFVLVLCRHFNRIACGASAPSCRGSRGIGRRAPERSRASRPDRERGSGLRPVPSRGSGRRPAPLYTSPWRP